MTTPHQDKESKRAVHDKSWQEIDVRKALKGNILQPQNTTRAAKSQYRCLFSCVERKDLISGEISI